jgi:hypothetical protein
MTPFIFIAVVFIVAVAAIGTRYSRQRRSETYDLEGTRRATVGRPRDGQTITGTGAGGGN